VTFDLALGVPALKSMISTLTSVSSKRQALVVRGGKRLEDSVDLVALDRPIQNGDTIVLIGTPHPALRAIAAASAELDALAELTVAAISSSDASALKLKDELLTQWLLRLDAISTEGDGEARAARKALAQRASALGERIAAACTCASLGRLY
jgi:hypothetical protein